MSTLLSKKYNVTEKNHTKHKDRIVGKKSDIKMIEKKINHKLNLIFKDRLMLQRKSNQEMIDYCNKKIKPEMDDLKYFAESYHIKRYVSNHAKSTITKVEHTIRKVFNS